MTGEKYLSAGEKANPEIIVIACLTAFGITDFYSE